MCFDTFFSSYNDNNHINSTPVMWQIFFSLSKVKTNNDCDLLKSSFKMLKCAKNAKLVA